MCSVWELEADNSNSKSYLWELQYLQNALVVYWLVLQAVQSPLAVSAVSCGDVVLILS